MEQPKPGPWRFNLGAPSGMAMIQRERPDLGAGIIEQRTFTAEQVAGIKPPDEYPDPEREVE